MASQQADSGQPGLVQSHGCLLALDPDGLVITQVSDNCQHWVGQGPTQLLGQPLKDVWGGPAEAAIRGGMLRAPLDCSPIHVLTTQMPCAPWTLVDISAHTINGVLLLEIERHGEQADEGGTESGRHHLIQRTLQHLKAATSLDEFCEVVAIEMRRLLQVDRVLVCKIHPDGSSEVVGESQRIDWAGWLGRRHAAGSMVDVALAVNEQGMHALCNASAEPCDIVPSVSPVTGQPLDLRHCALRAMPSRCTAYLQSLGVSAALSLPLNHGDRLWGLIACHHEAPTSFPPDLRAAVAFLGQIIELRIGVMQPRARQAYRLQLDEAHRSLARQAMQVQDLAVLLGPHANLLDGIQSDGVAVLDGGHWHVGKEVPSEAQLNALAQWLMGRGDTPYHTDGLPMLYPPASTFAQVGAGLLAIAIPDSKPVYRVLWFRSAQPDGWAKPWDKVEINAARSLKAQLGEVLITRLLKATSDNKAREPDLRAQRLSEERLRLALQIHGGFFFDWDPLTDLVVHSAAAAPILGLPPGEELCLDTGRAFFRWLHPDDAKAFMARVRALTPASPTYTAVYLLLRHDGSQVALEECAKGVFDEQGRLTRLVGLVTEVTQRRQIEQDREQVLEAERAARAGMERLGILKDEFLATVAHELRSPLGAIVGWAHLVARKHHDPAVLSQGIDAISRNARALARLIDDLLDTSRVASGKLTMAVDSLDVNLVVASAVNALRPKALARGVEMKMDLADPMVKVVGDADRLHQVLTNLVGNALKFTPTGGQVTVRTCVADDGHACIEVADNGLGIDPGFLPHLFNRFSQADHSAARTNGLGLGLSICKDLVDLHGGTVTASSAGLGAGSTFTVHLPAQVLTEPSQTGHEATDQGPWTEPGFLDGKPLAGCFILLVDDHSDVLALNRRLLGEAGAHVTAVSSAREALDHLVKGRLPDVLVSDIGMPGMDGHGLINHIRTSLNLPAERLPAVALTAFAREQDRLRALTAGYQAVIVKPFRSLLLIRTLKDLLA